MHHIHVVSTARTNGWYTCDITYLTYCDHETKPPPKLIEMRGIISEKETEDRKCPQRAMDRRQKTRNNGQTKEKVFLKHRE